LVRIRIGSVFSDRLDPDQVSTKYLDPDPDSVNEHGIETLLPSPKTSTPVPNIGFGHVTGTTCKLTIKEKPDVYMFNPTHPQKSGFRDTVFKCFGSLDLEPN
jgi:hypothetical protein